MKLSSIERILQPAATAKGAFQTIQQITISAIDGYARISRDFNSPCGNYGSKTTPCRCTPKEPVSGTHLRAAAGPHRHPAGGDGAGGEGDHGDAPGGKLGCDPRARAGGPGEAAGAFPGGGHFLQRPTERAAGGRGLRAGRRREADAGAGLREVSPVHAGGEPGAEGGEDHRGPGGEREDREEGRAGGRAVPEPGGRVLEVKRHCDVMLFQNI